MFSITGSTIAPSAMPITVPSPPRRLHPPRTAPRIAISSHVTPALSD